MYHSRSKMFCKYFGSENNTEVETKKINEDKVLKNEQNTQFDSRFKGNTLVFGPTGSGKTTIIKSLIGKGLYENVKHVFWISNRKLSTNEIIELEKVIPSIVFFSVNSKEELDYNLVEFENLAKKLKTRSNGGLLIVVDDLMTTAYKCDRLTDLMATGRHHDLHFIVCLQTIRNRTNLWQTMTSNSYQLIFTRNPHQAKLITQVLQSISFGVGQSTMGKGLSKRTEIVSNVYRNEVMASKYGSLLIVTRPDVQNNECCIRTEFTSRRLQYVFNINSQGYTKIKTQPIRPNSFIFSIDKTYNTLPEQDDDKAVKKKNQSEESIDESSVHNSKETNHVTSSCKTYKSRDKKSDGFNTKGSESYSKRVYKRRNSNKPSVESSSVNKKQRRSNEQFSKIYEPTSSRLYSRQCSPKSVRQSKERTTRSISSSDESWSQSETTTSSES